MKQFVQSLFGLRKGERGLALLMFFYHYLLLITLYLLKPVRDSLFLSEQGADRLPFVFILVAVLVMPASAAYARVSRTIRLSRLINAVSLFLVVNLLGFYMLVEQDAAWVYYGFYVWVSIYGVLVTSQYWLLANAVFDAAQAKRVFGMLSLGAILGAATGGEVTGLLTKQFGLRPNHLILLAAGLLAATIGLVNGIRLKYYREMQSAGTQTSQLDQQEEEGGGGMMQTLRESRHLALIVGVIALTVLTTTFIDFQFKTEAAAAYPTESGLTTFMGRFYGRVSLIAFVLQLIFSAQLIQRISVGGAILALPASLAAASVGMLVAPGLVAATLLRGADQSLKHSIDKTGRELLFLPVPMKAKKRAKVFIDLFVDQGAQGVAGVLLVIFTVMLDLSVLHISIVVLALLGGWIAVAILVRNSYVDRFRQMLDEQTEEADGPQVRAPSTIEDFRQLLNKRDTGHILSWLEQFAEEDQEREVSASELRDLIDHESAEVRRRALQVLRFQLADAEELLEPVAAHLEDPDDEVRLAAARYLYQNLNGKRLPLLKRGLEHPDFRVRAAALGFIAREGGAEERELVTERNVRAMLEYEGEAAEEVRVQAAHVLGVRKGAAFTDMLRRFLNDASPAVVRQAIKSAGQTEKRVFVPALLDRLQGEAYQSEAREALSNYGDRILGTFYDYLNDEHVDERLRRRIPQILALHPSQASADLLLSSLERVTVPVRYRVAKALSKMRREETALRFGWNSVKAALQREIRRYGALGQALYVRSQTQEPAAEQFPAAALTEARAASLECIFRLLGLRYAQRDIFHAYLGLTGDDRSLRAGAVEFLDNLLGWEIKRTLMQLLDDATGEQAARKGGELLDLHLQSWTDALLYLLSEKDPELNVLAIQHAALEASPDVLKRVEAAQHHTNPSVREAAQQALQARVKSG